jgi:pimeloyl-ACP methyl ester carboxylesterase
MLIRPKQNLFVLLLLASVFSVGQTQAAAPKVPGRMVDIGGYRLHIDCTGKGSPVVILEYGLGDSFADWALVQPEVAKFTKVCSYDRAYDGFSDAGPIPVTMHQQVYELHKLLNAAQIRSPYILVGHSYGGLLARLYTTTYPREVAGLVFVDSTHEDVHLGEKMFREMAKGTPVPSPQTMKSSPPLPFTAEEQKVVDRETKQHQLESQQPAGSPFYRLPPEAQQLDRWAHMHMKFSSSSKGVLENWLPEELQQIHNERAGKNYQFGDKPIIVLGARKANPGDFAARQAQLKDMASLSKNSRLFIDEESSHHIQWDNPSLVIQSIRDVFDSAKKHSILAKWQKDVTDVTTLSR